MRSILVSLLLACTASIATAAPLPVHGTLSFDLGGYGILAFTGSAIGSSAGGAGSAASVPAGLFAGTTDYSQPISPPQSGVALITVQAPFGNAAGSFAPNGAMGNSIVAHLFFQGGAAAGMIPLGYVGGGGTGMVLVSGLPVTIIGATWTNLGVGPGNPTAMTALMHVAGGIPITVTATAIDDRTAGGAGTLQLIAPAALKLFGGSLGTQPLIGTLTLNFVPEPGTMVLVGAGVAALTAVARRRQRGKEADSRVGRRAARKRAKRARSEA